MKILKLLPIELIAGILTAVLVLSSCELGLFQTIAAEVDEHNVSKLGSPEFSLSQGVLAIGEGEDADIGIQSSGIQKNVTFTINNTGTAPLELNGFPRIALFGTNVSEYEIVSLPGSIVNPGAKSDFVVGFTPAGAGDKTVSLEIPNNSSPTTIFSFNILGVGVVGAGPEIQVIEDSESIVIDNIPGYVAEFDQTAVTDSFEKDFTITNIGTTSSTLTLTGNPDVIISGTDADQFSVTVQPDRQFLIEGVAGQDSTTFTIAYTPVEIGDHLATVSIHNDEVNADERPYIFDISGSSFGIDVAFIVDVSGSMGSWMAEVKTGIVSGMSYFRFSDPSAKFGLAVFSDFPISPYGYGADVPYQNLADIGTDDSTFTATLNSLYASSGADPEGSVLDAFAGVAGVETINYGDGDGVADGMDWRTGSIRIAILISNSGVHNYPDDNYGYPGVLLAETVNALQADDVHAGGIIDMGYTSGETIDLLSAILCPETDGVSLMTSDVYNGVQTIAGTILSLYGL